MGIREHLSKQTDEKDMKISDLSLEQETGSEIDFDFEKLFSEEEIKDLLRDIQEIRFRISGSPGVLQEWRSIVYEVMLLRDIFPSGKEELGIDNAMWKGLVSDYKKEGPWQDNLLPSPGIRGGQVHG